MKTFEIYQVDAFAEELFSGNPAAICMLPEWLDEKVMQQVAAENNLAETAFLVKRNQTYEIRWFTPAVEVDLCGHATLAAAYVLFNHYDQRGSEVVFSSARSGILKVQATGDLLFLDFPADKLVASNEFEKIGECIGMLPKKVFRGKTDYIAVVEQEKDVLMLTPDLNKTARLDARGLIVTAQGTEVDFVSRFFAPQSGIDEDPVTGSAHTSLIPLWSERLGKTEMTALQLSKRGGKLVCRNAGDRSIIGGKAKLYLKGEIYLDIN